MSNRYKGAVISATPPTLVAGAGASGTWTLEQQMQATAAGLWPVNGPFYIEDVFSTYLYTGTGANQTITNGIDESGKGAMTWIKCRTDATSHALYDTERGAGRFLTPNATSAQSTSGSSRGLSSFNSTGFSLDDDSFSGRTNQSGQNYASWTFRKQPKFFDIVTYTGNGDSGPQTISHNLGSVPGVIICKTITSVASWGVYHRSVGATKGLSLNSTQAEQVNNTLWNDTAPTSTTFTVGASGGSSSSTNADGQTYVAYLFAHDAGGFGLTGTDNVISCGSVTGSQTVNLGYEPQLVISKCAGSTGDWSIVDNMRGAPTPSSGTTPYSNVLVPNTSAAETTAGLTGSAVIFNSTGFRLNPDTVTATTYIYIAIRRGPMAVPTSGTTVFNPYAYTATGTSGRILTGASAPDADVVFQFNRTGGCGVVDRLRGFKSELGTYDTGAESSATYGITSINDTSIYQNAAGGFYVSWNFGSNTYVSETFARAPGFFDEVCYTGTGSATTFAHNLGVVPELMIVKSRDIVKDWVVYAASEGANKFCNLNLNDIFYPEVGYWNNTAPTSTVFTLGTRTWVNQSGATYVNFLFATCPGVSKVGSYTGTGAAQTINCGFTGGARFVLIKRTDSTGDWYVWDSARGIIPSNDPYLLINSTAAEVTGTDYVDTTNVGFDITSTAPAAINANGGTFIFLAIA